MNNMGKISKPLISYVVPTYNNIAWLPECLQGLLSQTVKDIEIIVVNDGSTDGTREFLDNWFSKFDQSIIIHNEKNIGAGNSRNKGNEIARSDIIGVCDGDDIYPIERTSEILKFFDKHKNGEMMNPPYVSIGYNNNILEKFDGESFDHEGMIKNGLVNYFCHPGSAYHKKDILEIGGYENENREFTDDYQMLKKWVDAGKKVVYAPPEYLCMHRILPHSMMSNHRGWDPKWVRQ